MNEIEKRAYADALATFGLIDKRADDAGRVAQANKFVAMMRAQRAARTTGVNVQGAVQGVVKNPTLALDQHALMQHIRSLGGAVPAHLRSGV